MFKLLNISLFGALFFLSSPALAQIGIVMPDGDHTLVQVTPSSGQLDIEVSCNGCKLTVASTGLVYSLVYTPDSDLAYYCREIEPGVDECFLFSDTSWRLGLYENMGTSALIGSGYWY